MIDARGPSLRLSRPARAPGGLDAAVERWVSAICAAGPRAIRLQKKLVAEWERLPIAEAVQQGIRAVVEARATDEPRRLMEAFVNRRRGSAPEARGSSPEAH